MALNHCPAYGFICYYSCTASLNRWRDIFLFKKSPSLLMATYSLVPSPCFWAAAVCVPAAASPALAHDAAAPSSSDAPTALVGASTPVNPVGAGGEKDNDIKTERVKGDLARVVKYDKMEGKKLNRMDKTRYNIQCLLTMAQCEKKSIIWKWVILKDIINH